MQYIMTGNIEQVVIWRPIVCCQLWVWWGKKIDNHIIMIEMTTQKKNLCWTFQEKTQHVLEVYSGTINSLTTKRYDQSTINSTCSTCTGVKTIFELNSILFFMEAKLYFYCCSRFQRMEFVVLQILDYTFFIILNFHAVVIFMYYSLCCIIIRKVWISLLWFCFHSWSIRRNLIRFNCSQWSYFIQGILLYLLLVLSFCFVLHFSSDWVFLLD